MRTVGLLLIAALISGCSALPMDGSVLKAVTPKPEVDVEPASCQCNVYCN